MKKILLFFAVCAVSALTLHAETFVKVTDVASLADGDKVIMAAEALNAVSAGFKTGTGANKYLEGIDASFSSGTTTLTDPVYLDLHKAGDYWNFTLGGKPIGNKAGSNDFDTDKKTLANFAISFGGDGNAIIVSQNKGESNATVQFYCNNTSHIFRLYSSTSQTPIQLYKMDESTIPEKVVTSVALNKSALELRVGETETLTVTVLPEEAKDKTVAWGSTDESKATVANGVITTKAEGTVKIWVKATAVENVSDTCVVTILPAAAVGDATYKAVQKAEYLPAGAKVFFGTVKDGENYVMGQYVSGNNIKGVAATYGEGRHSVTAPLQVAYTVERDGDYYLFVDHDGKYLRTISSSKLGNGAKDDYAKWTLGAIDEDDATVVLKATSGKGIYNNFQGTNDLFNIYDGIGDGTNLAKTILYSDKAPDWVERVKNPWMKAESTTLDWGDQDKDPYSNDWGDSRTVNLTMNDLPADMTVTLTDDGNGTFSCYTGTISASKTSEHFSVYWEATKKGLYTGKITITCGDLTPIVITLRANAIDTSTDPQYQPSFSASVNHIYLNPNYSNNSYNDLQGFTFSASNLKKNLYCKWEHSGSVLFDYAYQNQYMEILVGEETLELNKSVTLKPTQDYKDVDVLISLSGLSYVESSLYQTQLRFYSPKVDNTSENAIDAIIPIYIKITEDPAPDPATGVESIQPSEVSCQKILRNGQVLIIRNGATYTLTGERL